MLCDLCATGEQMVTIKRKKNEESEGLQRRQALTVKYNQRLKIRYKYMHIFNNYTQNY